MYLICTCSTYSRAFRGVNIHSYANRWSARCCRCYGTLIHHATSSWTYSKSRSCWCVLWIVQPWMSVRVRVLHSSKFGVEGQLSMSLASYQALPAPFAIISVYVRTEIIAKGGEPGTRLVCHRALSETSRVLHVANSALHCTELVV